MKTILIIEDDVVFGRSIGNWLRKKGMDTAHVGTLSAARKELQAKEFDLVLRSKSPTSKPRLPHKGHISIFKLN